MINDVTMLTDQAAHFHKMGRLDAAHLTLLKALEADPNHPGALHLMGIVLLGAGEPLQARTYIEHLLNRSPEDHGAQNTLAGLCKALGDMEGAISAMEAATALAPEHAVYHLNLGGLLRQHGRAQDGAKAYMRALEIDPSNTDAKYSLARMAAVAEQTTEAIHWYDALLGDQPGHVQAWKGKAEMLVMDNRADQARDALLEGLSHVPDAFALRLGLTQCLPQVYETAEQIQSVRHQTTAAFDALLAHVPQISDPLREGGATNFSWPYQGLDDRPAQEALAKIYIKAAPSLEWTAPHVAKPSTTLRVGFVSAFFGEHTISRLNAGLMAGLGARGVDVTVFSLAPPTTPIYQPIADSGLRIVTLPRNLEEARQALGEEAMDILYYTDLGMEPLSYFLAFARLAPVQCASWGHPHTTGIPNMDYFLSSHRIERAEAQDDYSETLVRFTDVNLTYAKPPARLEPLDRGELGLAGDDTIYLCCQTSIKIHPDFDEMTRSLLQQNSKARLIFMEGRYPAWDTALKSRMDTTLGPVYNQVLFVPRMPRDDFLRLLATADVILDTPHFSGGNTVLEAISVGTPYVTIEGRYMRGRMAAGLLRQIGLDEMVAQDGAEFVTTATKLGAAPDLRRKISERMQDGLPLLHENPGLIDEMSVWMKSFG